MNMSKAYLTSLLLSCIMCISMSAQSYYKDKAGIANTYNTNVKGTKRVSSKERVKTSSFENGWQFALGYSMPFPADMKGQSRYGARAEAGYITNGQCSFYTGLAYQYSGIGGVLNEHDIVLPEQFSVRFNPGVPIQLKAGPFVGVNVYNAYKEKDFKSEYLCGKSFSDLFLCGLQVDFSISYFYIGYTLERNPMFGKKLNTSLLTVGITF